MYFFHSSLLMLVISDSLGSDDNRKFNREFIVSFDGYYNDQQRRSYIEEALDDEPFNLLSNHRTEWSDFDVIELSNNAGLKLIEKHARVRRVSAERKIRRDTLSVGGQDQRKLDARFNRTDQNSGFLFGKLKSEKGREIARLLRADLLWDMGFKGQGVKVAIFDTGLSADHPHIKHVVERTDWTNEGTPNDGVGHGTFVAGVIASNAECLGFAPEAELHIYKVFTNQQTSYTSWFLDAFNYAILKGVHVLNLSIGGPDFMDQPFIDKVWELTANGVVMVSAIGNDGPLFGTLNNPADQMDVIGIGCINFDDQIAKFSSRGMTTWELPEGYGRVKPDLVTYGSTVYGSALGGGCRSLSGTSVASPVVTGAISLLLSTVKDRSIINPSVIKQALMAGASRLPNSAGIFEQGFGKMNLMSSFRVLQSYKPQASLSPNYIDLTECPYMWPYCTQPLYAGAMPVIVNVTVMNGMSVSGTIVDIVWEPFINDNGQFIRVAFDYSRELWPWSGWLAVYVSVTEHAARWHGTVAGQIRLKIDAHDGQTDQLTLPLRARVIATPSRNKRILWDQYHNIRYPSGYLPRDNLRIKNDPLDWNGDHIHTNFKELYQHLRSAGYYVEVLGQPFTCFDANHYGFLLIVDPEEEYFAQERMKLWNDVHSHGLNVLIFADWYNSSVMNKIRFYDDNTKQWWNPTTGGSNLPALNNLLQPWNLSLSSGVFDGEFSIGGRKLNYASGTSIHNATHDFLVLRTDLKDQGEDVLVAKPILIPKVPILALSSQSSHNYSKGIMAVYGDSNCLDSAHIQKDCFWLLTSLLEYGTHGHLPAIFNSHLTPWSNSFSVSKFGTPKRLADTQFVVHSKVVNYMDSKTTTFKDTPECKQLNWAVGSPLHNFTSPNNFYKSYKLLSLSADLDYYSEKLMNRFVDERVLPDSDQQGQTFVSSTQSNWKETIEIIVAILNPSFTLRSILLWLSLAIVLFWIVRYIGRRRRRLRRIWVRLTTYRR